jgi:hypothetical protein
VIEHAAKSGHFHYYRCGNALRRGPQACKTRWLPQNKLESFIIDRIKEYIFDDNNLEELIRLTNNQIEVLANNKAGEDKIIHDQMLELQSRLDHLYDALETGKFSHEELSRRINKLLARKAETQQILNKSAEQTESKM